MLGDTLKLGKKLGRFDGNKLGSSDRSISGLEIVAVFSVIAVCAYAHPFKLLPA